MFLYEIGSYDEANLDLPRALVQTDLDTDNETPKSRRRGSSKRLCLDQGSSSEEDVTTKKPCLVLAGTTTNSLELPIPPSLLNDNGLSTSTAHFDSRNLIHQAVSLPSPAAISLVD